MLENDFVGACFLGDAPIKSGKIRKRKSELSRKIIASCLFSVFGVGDMFCSFSVATEKQSETEQESCTLFQRFKRFDKLERFLCCFISIVVILVVFFIAYDIFFAVQNGSLDYRKRPNNGNDIATKDRDCSKKQEVNHEKGSDSDKRQKFFGNSGAFLALKTILLTAIGWVAGVAVFHKIDEHLINDITKKISTDNNSRGVKTKFEFNQTDKSLITVENEKSKRVSGDSTNSSVVDDVLFLESSKNMVEEKVRKGNTSNNENVTNIGNLRGRWDNVSRESDFEIPAQVKPDISKDENDTVAIVNKGDKNSE